MRKPSAGAARKRAFAGFNPSANPVTSPPTTASCRAPVSKARTQKYAATSSATIDG